MGTFLADLGSIAGVAVSLSVVVFSREVLALVVTGWYQWQRLRHDKRVSNKPGRIGPTNNISICLTTESVASDITKSTRDKSSRGNHDRRTSESSQPVDSKDDSPSQSGTDNGLPRTSVDSGKVGGTALYNDINTSVRNAKFPTRRTSCDDAETLECDLASFAEQSDASVHSPCEAGDDSMTLGACNTSLERTTSVDTIGSNFTFSTEVPPQREEPIPKISIDSAPAKLEKHNAATRIAQSVKRKMQAQRYRFPRPQLASSSNTVTPDSHLHSSHPLRPPSPSTSVSESIDRDQPPIALRRRDSIGRRTSLGRSQHEEKQRRLHPSRSVSDDKIVRSYTGAPSHLAAKRSISEAIMRSSAHRRNQLYHPMNSSIDGNVALRQNSRKPKRSTDGRQVPKAASRAFRRSNSDVAVKKTFLNSVVESPGRRKAIRRSVSSRLVSRAPSRSSSRLSTDSSGRQRCLTSSTSFRDLSNRPLPRRGSSMQSTDSGGRRGCLAGTKIVGDLPRPKLVRRGSSISKEDLKILRKVESSKNLFGY